MDPVSILLGVVLIPAVLVGLPLGASTQAGDRVRPLLGALALALCWGGGAWGVLDGVPWPPVEAPQYLFYFALPALLIGAVPLPAAAGAALRVVLAGLLLWPMSGPKLEYSWTGGEAALWLGGGALLLGGVWAAVDRAADTRPAPVAALPVALTAALGAAALGGTGSIVYGKLGGVLATGLGLNALLALLRKDAPTSRAALAVGLPMVLGMLFAGVWFSQLPLPAALLLGLAPLGALAPKADGKLPVGPLALSGVLALAGLATAMAIAGSGAEAAPSGYGSEPW